jgi:hypothetical protein
LLLLLLLLLMMMMMLLLFDHELPWLVVFLFVAIVCGGGYDIATLFCFM